MQIQINKNKLYIHQHIFVLHQLPLHGSCNHNPRTKSEYIRITNNFRCHRSNIISILFIFHLKATKKKSWICFGWNSNDNFWDIEFFIALIDMWWMPLRLNRDNIGVYSKIWYMRLFFCVFPLCNWDLSSAIERVRIWDEFSFWFIWKH